MKSVTLVFFKLDNKWVYIRCFKEESKAKEWIAKKIKKNPEDKFEFITDNIG